MFLTHHQIMFKGSFIEEVEIKSISKVSTVQGKNIALIWSFFLVTKRIVVELTFLNNHCKTLQYNNPTYLILINWENSNDIIIFDAIIYFSMQSCPKIVFLKSFFNIENYYIKGKYLSFQILKFNWTVEN